MDPLSIAVGVMGLLGLAGQVLDRVRKYYHSVHKAANTAAEFAAELEILQSHLKRLSTFLHHQHDKGIVFGETCVLQSSVNACQVKLTLLDQKLAKTHGTDSVRHKLKWPLEEKEHRESISDIRAFGQWIQMGLTVDGCILLSKTSEDVLRILGQQLHHFQMLQSLQVQSGTLEVTINETAKIIKDNRETKVRDKILDWISTNDPNIKHDAIRAPRVEGTGAWLLQTDEYRAWHDVSDSNNFLWCFGMPGAGKSVLASVIVDNVRNELVADLHALAFFYFDYREQQVLSTEVILGSILRQFVSSTNSIPKVLHDIYDNPKSPGAKLTLTEMEDVILGICDSVEAAYLVLDAFDEVEESGHRKQLLNILGRFAQNPHARILITSRPVGYDAQVPTTSTSQMTVEASEPDLQIFLRSRIDNGRTADMMDENFKHQVIETVLQKARGMFLLAELQIRAIVEQPDFGHMKLALRTMPASLSSALGKAIDRIQGQPRYFSKLGMDTLLWISHAKVPLRVNELRDALATPSSNQDLDIDFRPLLKYILESCYGLVTVDAESSMIRLSHYSIQEYLQSHRQELFPDGESFVTQQCLKYLSFDEFRQGPLETREKIQRRRRRYELCNYAASQWGFHAQAVRDAETMSKILSFLHNSQLAASAHQIMRVVTGYRIIYCSKEESYSCNPLHTACHFGIMTVAKHLLESQKFGVDAPTKMGSTALIRAAAQDHVDLVQLLLTYGADPYQPNWYGNSLHCAAEAGCCAIIKVLVKSNNVKVDCRTKYGSTPLHCCVDIDQAAAASALLNLGADMYATDENGHTALHKACKCNAEAMVTMLCQSGMNLELRNTAGRTALHIAADYIRPKIVLTLLDYGADIEARDSKGRTPLLIAIDTHYDVVVECLLRRGADSRISVHGQTALSTVMSALALEKERNNEETESEREADIAEMEGIRDLLIAYGAEAEVSTTPTASPLTLPVREC